MRPLLLFLFEKIRGDVTERFSLNQADPNYSGIDSGRNLDAGQFSSSTACY